MKLRTATPASNLSRTMRTIILFFAVIVSIAVPVQYFSSQSVGADEYDAKIRVLEGQISNYREQATELRAKANTLRNKIDSLTAEKGVIQGKIDLNQVQYNQLVDEIKATEQKIEENRRESGRLIVKSSLSEDIPLIVRLASSENLADYIDGEVTRISVRDTIVQKTEENEKLKIVLVAKREKVKSILDEQKTQRDLLLRNESEQRSILAQVNGDEAKYQQLIKKNNEAIETVRAQQAAALAALQNAGGSTGGRTTTTNYEYKGWPTNYNDNCMYPSGRSGADRYGYCVRQCGSYVAWKLDSIGNRGNYSYLGHAYNWFYAGSTVDKDDVKRGDVVVWVGGPYGHVMFVEAVSGGVISYTDYNGAGGPVSPGVGTISTTAATSGAYKVIRF